ncbi:hypothetical protein C3V39_02235 [Prevotella sp. oral taxon 820]|nr:MULTISPECIES: DUF6452 family protein [Prevotella]PTL25986.1 hypothetical protein C3V39_02235 [Prevotella sp. oral taxon 820]
MRKMFWLLAAMAILVAACSTIDCSLNSRVAATYKLAGDVKKLATPLTVTAYLGDGNDSVILNKLADADSFQLPMSYNHHEDTFYFKSDTTANAPTDTVVITKEDIPHFEAVDCNPIFFHEIKGVRHTRHFIDSIVVNNKHVTNGPSKSNFFLYLKSDIH